MTAIATRADKLGSLVKYEQGTEQGFCREVKTVTLTPTSSIGDVLYDNAGDLELVAVANTANAEAILVDTTVYDLRPATGTVDVSMAVLVRGSAIVADKALNYNADINTDAEILALHAVLEAAGILVRAQV
tara:strand:+ start:334 stop:726 length:393 start_codon:yes stop_codon:yes gene_type:complete